MKIQHFHFTRESSDQSLCPKWIWQIPDAPQELYMEGTEKALQLLQLLPSRGLAIVGTRNPQPRSILFLKQEIQKLRDSGLVILSGFARGIDSIAHSASISANIPTVAILGAGLDINYPTQNLELRQRLLLNDGLLISEYPPGSPAVGFHFLRRNRLIAAYSMATWVVEAAHRSGALNTAAWARDLGRTCFALPSFPGDHPLSGNQVLIDRDHALAYWGAHSLGAVWLDLAARHPIGDEIGSTLHLLVDGETKLLVQKIRSLTHSQGGVQPTELLEWATSENQWSTEFFFRTIGAAIQNGLVSEQRGQLISIT